MAKTQKPPKQINVHSVTFQYADSEGRTAHSRTLSHHAWHWILSPCVKNFHAVVPSSFGVYFLAGLVLCIGFIGSNLVTCHLTGAIVLFFNHVIFLFNFLTHVERKGISRNGQMQSGSWKSEKCHFIWLLGFLSIMLSPDGVIWDKHQWILFLCISCGLIFLLVITLKE